MLFLVDRAGLDRRVVAAGKIFYTPEKVLDDFSAFATELSGERVDLHAALMEVIPEALDRVMLAYNEIQKAQGLDLSGSYRKKVQRYTYTVENCKQSGVTV